MKLKQHWIELNELQDYLDKYEEKIKFIVRYEQYTPDQEKSSKFLLVIDEE